MLPSMGGGIAAAGKRLISAGIRTSAAPLMLSEGRASAAGCLMGKRSIFAGGGGRGLLSASVAASRGGIWAGAGAAAPLIWRRGDLMRAAPSMSMSADAAPKEVEEKPKRDKKKSLVDLCMTLDDFGVGFRMAKRSWTIPGHTDSYYVITKVQIIGKKKVWGVKVWKGRVYERNRQIAGLFSRGKWEALHREEGELEAMLKASEEMVRKHEEDKAARRIVHLATRPPRKNQEKWDAKIALNAHKELKRTLRAWVAGQ